MLNLENVPVLSGHSLHSCLLGYYLRVSFSCHLSPCLDLAVEIYITLAYQTAFKSCLAIHDGISSHCWETAGAGLQVPGSNWSLFNRGMSLEPAAQTTNTSTLYVAQSNHGTGLSYYLNTNYRYKIRHHTQLTEARSSQAVL